MSAASRGRGAEGKVAGVGDTAEGQRFVSFSKKPKVKNAVLNLSLTSSLMNSWAGNENQ